MNRATVKLSDLKPNPFKKDILGGRITSSRVEELKESIKGSDLWEHWVVRKTSNGYELGNGGHHTLEAALEIYGPKHEVSVQVENWSDAQMLFALAAENAGKGASFDERVDVVLAARKFLQEHPESCKHVNPAAQGKRDSLGRVNDGRTHEHGSASCVSAFLGSKTWPVKTVEELLRAGKDLAPEVRKMVAPSGTTHPNRKQQLPQKGAIALGVLSKEKQKEVASILKEAMSQPGAKDKIGEQEIKRVAKLAEAKPIDEVKKVVNRMVSDDADLSEEEFDHLKQFNKKVEEARKTEGPSKLYSLKVPEFVVRLAKEIVKEGRRALALKYHPDRGGKTEDMAAVNAAEQWLSTIISKEAQ